MPEPRIIHYTGVVCSFESYEGLGRTYHVFGEEDTTIEVREIDDDTGKVDASWFFQSRAALPAFLYYQLFANNSKPVTMNLGFSNRDTNRYIPIIEDVIAKTTPLETIQLLQHNLETYFGIISVQYK